MMPERRLWGDAGPLAVKLMIELVGSPRWSNAVEEHLRGGAILDSLLGPLEINRREVAVAQPLAMEIGLFPVEHHTKAPVAS